MFARRTDSNDGGDADDDAVDSRRINSAHRRLPYTLCKDPTKVVTWRETQYGNCRWWARKKVDWCMLTTFRLNDKKCTWKETNFDTTDEALHFWHFESVYRSKNNKHSRYRGLPVLRKFDDIENVEDVIGIHWKPSDRINDHKHEKKQKGFSEKFLHSKNQRKRERETDLFLFVTNCFLL